MSADKSSLCMSTRVHVSLGLGMFSNVLFQAPSILDFLREGP